MTNKLFKRIFPLFSLTLPAPWSAAYAQDNAEHPVEIQAAKPYTAPSWNVLRKAIAGARAGDLFYININATNYKADKWSSLIPLWKAPDQSTGLPKLRRAPHWESCIEKELQIRQGLIFPAVH